MININFTQFKRFLKRALFSHKISFIRNSVFLTTFWRVSSVIAEIAAQNLVFSWEIVEVKLLNTQSLIFPQRKKLQGIRSGDWGGPVTGPSSPIQRFPNLLFQYWRTRIANWGGEPFCWRLASWGYSHYFLRAFGSPDKTVLLVRSTRQWITALFRVNCCSCVKMWPISKIS